MLQFRIDPITERTGLIRLDPSASPTAPMKQLFCLDTQYAKAWIEGRHQCDHGTPIRTWHGFVLEWKIPITADAKSLSEAINAGALDTLLTRICVNSETIWDGNNHVRRFNEDARRAADEVETWLRRWAGTLDDHGGLWDAGDWFDMCPPEEVTADSTDAELDALVELLEEQAKADGVVLARTRAYLERLREKRREEIAE